jgi:hypothetical protein
MSALPFMNDEDKFAALLDVCRVRRNDTPGGHLPTRSKQYYLKLFWDGFYLFRFYPKHKDIYQRVVQIFLRHGSLVWAQEEKNTADIAQVVWVHLNRLLLDDYGKSNKKARLL